MGEDAELYKFSVSDPVRLKLLAAEGVYQARLDEGDFIEMGVYYGGSAIWLAQALADARSPRTLHLLDSWEGLPEPTDGDGPAQVRAGMFDTASESQVRQLLDHFSLGAFCRTYRGWFKDTLAGIPGPFALAHVDCDLYDSCKTCLDYLLPRMTAHGTIIVDDYGTPGDRAFPGVARAVSESVAATGWVVCPLGGERDQSIKLVRSLGS